MAQEEHFLGCSYSGGGAASGGGGGGGVCSIRSKKVKQKKVPQRGLGVAQLERIRVEEQKKKEALEAANVLANKAIDIQSPKFRPNALFRHTPSSPNLDTLHEVQIPKKLCVGGVELGADSNPSSGNSNWPRLNSSSEYNLVGDKQMLDHHGFAFRPPNEPNGYGPVLPLPSVRSHQFQQPFSFPSMVNASSLSILSSQVEPPSNQISRGNNHTPSWPDEDKMVGMKRSYPFSLENALAPSFNCNRYAPQTEPRNKYIRGPSISCTLSEPNSNDVIRDNVTLNGDFLTLAPPEVDTSPLSNSMNKSYCDYSSQFEYMVHQENAESHNHLIGERRSIEGSFSFFPMKLQNDQNTPHVSSGIGENGETIDLNLKL